MNSESSVERVSINPFDNLFLHRAERADLSNTVPGVRRARFAANGFVALQKTGHEKLLRQSRQLDAPPGVVIDQFFGLVRVHDPEHGARLGRVVSDGKLVFGLGIRARTAASYGRRRPPAAI